MTFKLNDPVYLGNLTWAMSQAISGGFEVDWFVGYVSYVNAFNKEFDVTLIGYDGNSLVIQTYTADELSPVLPEHLPLFADHLERLHKLAS